MNIKINVLLIAFLFIAFPFIYFYFLIKNNISFLLTPGSTYPIIIIFGLFLAFFVDMVLRNKVKQETKKYLFIIFTICVGVYAAFLLLMTWSRYASFVSEVIDVSFFHQVVWQLSEFKVPYLWNLNQQLYPAWSQHFYPILIFFAPVYWFTKDAGSLMFIQALVVISGAYPIYLIAKHYLKSRSVGLALSFAYLAFGGLQFGFAYGFHEIMLFPTLFLWAYYFYLRKKTKSYFLFILLSLMVKEEVAFILFFWSIYLLIVKRDKFFGFTTAAMSLLWYFLCFNIIFPHFNNGQDFGYWGQYGREGDIGILGIIKYLFFNPLGFFTTLVTPSIKIDTFLQTFGAFSFLLFLYPPSFIIVIPSLLEKFLSSGIAMGNGAHYSAAITAVTIVATFESFPHFYQNKLIRKITHDKNIFFSVLIFYVAFFSNIFFGYRGYSLIPYMHSSIYERGLSKNNSKVLSQIINSIPDNATVSAGYQITPHINKHYKKITIWPGMSGTEDFVIIDTELLPVLGASGDDYNKAIDKLNNNQNYQLAVNNFGVLVYRKKSFTVPNNQL